MMPGESQCSLEYVCAGCNRTTQALSWGSSGLIAYGACNSVIVYQPHIKNSAGKIVGVLTGHRSRVNCTQWLENNEQQELELLSGSSDNDIIVWRKEHAEWGILKKLSGHKNAVCSISSVVYKTDADEMVSLITSASADSTVKFWRRFGTEGDFECIQTLSFGNGFVHALALAKPSCCNGVLLACGCDDTLIRLYIVKKNELCNVLNLKGHEDWIRCLAFTKTVGDDLLLASGSQDMYIRLWRISSNNKQKSTTDSLMLKEQSFTFHDKKFTVVLESVLIAHEGWVYGVSWSPFTMSTPVLLSASMDKTMIVWEYDKENEVWIDSARMGDVGGNTLGFYGCAYGPDSNTIIAHGYQGSFQMWTKEATQEESTKWNSSVTISGHFGAVEDFDWDPEGEFVVTTSTDQTTRLFAPWRRETHNTTWHEIARPQIHGYDMKCITMLNRYKYAAGAQEKVIRVFAAPKSFYDSFSHISNIHEEEKIVASLPLGATIPVLGLSNKAVYEGDIQSWEGQKEKVSQPMKASAFANEDPAPFNPALIKEPPVEDILLQNTLWPEIQKLYGHGFEIFCLDSSSDGEILATACKASKAEYANILIWNTSTWDQTDSLGAHSLTVSQIAFSHHGQYLLSVSRDRTWALHKQNSDDKFKFTLLQKTDKKTGIHSRIIWSCTWCYDDQYFVTASRDKKLIVWGNNDGQCWCAKGDALDVGEPATAVSVANTKSTTNKYIIAAGLESGGIHLYTYSDIGTSPWTCLLKVEKSLCPTLTVKRLRWRPNVKKKELWQIGTCSNDHSFRIMTFRPSIFV